MGKVKAWLMDMEEDAMWMSRDSWAARHGSHNLDVFDKARDKYEGHIVEDLDVQWDRIKDKQ
tara:strand:- start:353 stop:538 length:186 start_codon:yes stop_codon:yes gene_type:complete